MTDPRRVDILDYVGGDFARIELTIEHQDGSGPINLTGADITWAIAPVSAGLLGDAIVTKALGDGLTVLDAPNGKLAIDLAKDEFEETGKFWHECQVDLPSGLSYTVAYGSFIAKPALLRA